MPLLPPIEGMADAVNKERVIRDRSFLGFNERINGIEVKPLTSRHILHLDEIESPFTMGGDFDAFDVISFLWIVSPKFRPLNRFSDAWTHYRFVRSVSKSAFKGETPEDALENAGQAIRDYIGESFTDGSGGNGERSISYFSWLAGSVAIVGGHFGWSEDTVLDLPIKRLLQYTRAINIIKNPEAKLFNKYSDQVRQDFINNLNAPANERRN